MFSLRKQFDRVIDRIKDVWPNSGETIINYYDTNIKVEDFFNRVDEIAKALVAL